MSTMHTVVLSLHTLIAILIVVLVLLQRGKGAEAGAAFGAGASGTVFGARGSASFFSRATAVMATAFFASSLALAYMSSQTSDAPDSLIETAPAVELEEGDTGSATGDLPDLPAAEDLGPSATDAGTDMPAIEPAENAPAAAEPATAEPDTSDSEPPPETP